MKNYIIIIVLSIICTIKTNAQNNVGIGTLNPNPKAVLELQSSDKGLLIPRLTTAQRIAIVGLGVTEKALLVFDTDINKFYYWDTTQWIGFPLDNDNTNELQNLVLQNDSILIENGIGIDVSNLLNNADDQNLTGATLNAMNILSIDIENGTSTTVDLSSLAGSTSSSDDDWYEYGTTNVPNHINDNLYTNGNVSIGLNNYNNFNLNVERNLMLTTNNSNQVHSSFKGILAGVNDTIGGGSYYNLIVGDNNKRYGITDGMYILGSGNYLGGISDNKYVFGNNNHVQTNGSNMSFTLGDDNYDNSNGSNIVIGRNNTMGSNGGNDYVIGRNNTMGSNGGNDYVIGRHNLSEANGGNVVIIGKNDTVTTTAYQSILIGDNLTATAGHSFSLGRKCLANRSSFYIGDASNTASDLTGGLHYSMNMRFRGGYNLFSDDALTSGVTLAPGGGAWASISDRNKKENFKALDKQEILNKLASFEIYNWNYISQEDSIRHIGPFAQDFYKAYQLGTSNKSIVTSDISGVNMLAIQALNEKLQKEIEDLNKKNKNLNTELEKMKRDIKLLMNYIVK